MLRKLFTLLLLVGLCQDSFAQKPVFYSFGSNTGTFSSVSGGGGVRLGIARATSGAGASLDDTIFNLGSTVIPFSFKYDNVTYTSLHVSTNGFVTFGSAPSTNNYTPVSSTQGYNGAISALGMNLNGAYTSSDTGQIWYRVVGTAPNREFVVEWKNFKPSSTLTGGMFKWSFQVRLKEDNSINLVYNYDSIGAPAADTFTAQVGLRGIDTFFVHNVKNRSITSGGGIWTNSAAGIANNSFAFISKGNRFPSGLTYTFTPPAACNATPSPGTIHQPAWYCTNSAIKLYVTGTTPAMDLSYQWEESTDSVNFNNVSGGSGSTSEVYTTPFLAAGIKFYRLKVTCINTSSSSFTNILKIRPGPWIGIGPDTAICVGSTITLDAGANMASIQWSNTQTTRFVTVNPGNYFVVVTDSNGCNGTDQIFITSKPSPFVNLGPDTAFCGGLSMTLDAGGGVTGYSWSTGDTTRTITVGATAFYTVTVTNSFGCTAQDGIAINVRAVPNVFLGADTGLCFGTSMILDAGNIGSTYEWTTNDTSRTITINGSGLYGVTVTNGFGCSAYSQRLVNSYSLPFVSLGRDTSFCGNDSVAISGPNDMAKYIWNNGDSIQSIVVYNAGLYWVIAIDSNGCREQDSIVFGTYPVPNANIITNDTTICKKATVTLDAGPGFTTYSWNTGGTTRTIQTGLAGRYSVWVTNNFGCKDMDTVRVTIDSISPGAAGFTVQHLGNRQYSFVPSVTAGHTHGWTFGDGGTSTSANPSYTYSSTGSYIICHALFNARGCFDTTCVTLNVTSTGKLPAVAQSVSAYPNPFTDGFVVAVDLKQAAEVEVKMYDITGREYLIAEKTQLHAGSHNTPVNSFKDMPVGIYTIKISINGAETFMKLIKSE